MIPLRHLSGNEIKVLHAVIEKSSGNRMENLETLTEWGLSYPTVLKCVGRLKKRGVWKVLDSGSAMIIEFVPPWDQFAQHVRNFSPQLVLFSEPPAPVRQTANLEMLRKIVRHYALLHDVKVDDPMRWKLWCHDNYMRYTRAASRLIMTCRTTGDDPIAVLTRADKYFRGMKVSWDFNGAFKTHLHHFIGQKDGKVDWGWGSTSKTEHDLKS